MKIKFLSYAVMAALFAVGITSCEEEDFNTKVDTEVTPPSITIPGITLPEGYKPGNAVISIQPTVWAVIDGVIQNVTEDAIITIDGVARKTYVESSATGFDEKNIEIEASYRLNVETTLTAKTTILVPELKEGQVAIFNPTLVMSAKTEGEGGEGEGEGSVSTTFYPVALSTTETVENGHVEFDNASNYYYLNVTKKMNIDVNSKAIENIEYNPAYEGNKEVEAIVDAYKSNEGSTEMEYVFNFDLWPNTKTCFAIQKTTFATDYKVNAKIETRAVTEETAATFTVIESVCIIDTNEVEYYNSGAGHTGHGHAHAHGSGHGHGADNAGGGIVWGI